MKNEIKKWIFLENKKKKKKKKMKKIKITINN